MDKDRDMEGEEGKTVDTNTGVSPDTRASPNSLELIYIVRK